MQPFDPRIDAYIEKSLSFAQPILIYIRDLVHKACPEVQETIKWGMPFFDYKGIMCNMAAFKQHAAFGFWKGNLLSDPEAKLIVGDGANAAMGHLGRITSLADLPKEKILTGYIKEAMRLNEDGIKVAAKPKVTKPEIPVPEFVSAALKVHKEAQMQWIAFSPSHRREYLEWIMEAKTEVTREKRLATMLEWLVDGKQRHWKYQK
jgi:uncharacterized protein YdeI (YjbR/CyaY-like superfamily)